MKVRNINHNFLETISCKKCNVRKTYPPEEYCDRCKEIYKEHNKKLNRIRDAVRE